MFRNMLTALCGQGCLLAISTADVTTWVTCICSAVIAAVTCALQVYHMWKDRDKEETDSDDSEDKTDDG